VIKNALQEPNSIIISEDLAMRLFNKKESGWQDITVQLYGICHEITGVLKNHSRNQFDFSAQ